MHMQTVLVDGSLIAAQPSKAAPGKVNILIFAASELAADMIILKFMAENPNVDFTLPTNSPDGVWCSIGRV